MEGYILYLNKNELLKILSNYLTIEKGKKIDVKEKHAFKKDNTSYGDNKEVEVVIYYEETIDILGHKAVKRTILLKEEIEEILNKLLQKDNYKIKELELITKVNRNFDVRERDYYYSPDFEGAKINIDQLSKTKQKKKA